MAACVPGYCEGSNSLPPDDDSMCRGKVLVRGCRNFAVSDWPSSRRTLHLRRERASLGHSVRAGLRAVGEDWGASSVVVRRAGEPAVVLHACSMGFGAKGRPCLGLLAFARGCCWACDWSSV